MTNGANTGFSGFFTMRVVGGIILGIAALWVVSFISDRFGGDDVSNAPKTDIHVSSPETDQHDTDLGKSDDDPFADDDPFKDNEFPLDDEGPDEHLAGGDDSHIGTGMDSRDSHGTPSVHEQKEGDSFPLDHGAKEEHAASPKRETDHGPAATTHGPTAAVHEPKAVGGHFVHAIIAALDHELNERFWGWRRNDLIRVTDNVENMQLGVLEVVRRACVVLTERISRHGVSASIDHNLENAMNWLMIKPSRYWLPSAEEKYGDSVKELQEYAEKLEKGGANFYVRADNLIPLLQSFADLAGSCDENLVKAVEEDGSPVSWFKTDDYFYYSKGVAKAMGKILHAVSEDFSSVVQAKQGLDLLERAMHACHVAAELDPWVITDASLDGVLANHRANMAAEISHLRYFLNALEKALAT